jgi:hypothetical protein
LAGNRVEEELFTIKVQDTTEPDGEIKEAVDRRNREITYGIRQKLRYIEITFEATLM